MELKFELKDKTLVAEINGEIDHHTSVNMREKIDKEIDRNFIKNIIFDFKDVSFMDSSGVGMVIGRYKKIEKLNGKVGIINLTPQIERVFEISGLFKIMNKFNSVEEALKNI